MRSLRSHLRALGQTVVDPDDLHRLTMDACMELADLAAGWRRDGGALPWVWAERLLRRLASDFVGQWSVQLDETVLDLPEAAPAVWGTTPTSLRCLSSWPRSGRRRICWSRCWPT